MIVLETKGITSGYTEIDILHEVNPGRNLLDTKNCLLYTKIQYVSQGRAQ